MDSPKLTYQKNKMNAAVLRKEYNTVFNDIYVSGTREKTGLGETDEEEKIKQLGKFIPGKIYTYEYNPLYKDVLSFYDTRPIIFVNDVIKASTGNDIVRGINLNFLPEEIRVATLEEFYKVFKDDINKSEGLAEIGKVNLAINAIVSFFSEWRKILQVFGGAGGVGYEYAYRNYIVSRIKDPRYVEYQHWEMLPYVNPLDIKGMSVAAIHKLYWSEQQNILAKQKKRAAGK